MVKNKKIVVSILILITYFGLTAWSQYSWAEKFKKEIGSDWIVFDEQQNAADPIFPYTFVFPPVNRIGAIKKSTIKKIDKGIFSYTQIWADGPIGNRSPTETFVSYADCDKRLNGYLKENSKEFTSLADLEWSSADENPYITNKEEIEKLKKKFDLRCQILANGMPEYK